MVVDLCVLGYFKYANFGVDSLNEIITSFGMQPFVLTHILLPIGISFYTFESISYIIDVYRGDTPATHNLIDFAAFVAIFPHLIAGPVLRFKDLVDQFNHRTHTVDKFAEGCTRFMQGFVKKVFIADTLAALADHCFALQNPTTGDAWLGALAYTAQLYFDFSGYSDMAIGLGLMMGFRFMENFNQPYISQSITEFWRRWHISLSTWLRDYLYISLGGNRGSTFQTYRNLFLTMPRRPVARRQLHLHHLGRLARHVAGDRAGPRSERRARAQPFEVGVHLPPGGDRLGDLPRREPAGRLAHVRSHVQLRHPAALRTEPRQPHRPAGRHPGPGLPGAGVLRPAPVLQPAIADQGAQGRGEQRRSGRRRPGQCPAARPREAAGDRRRSPTRRAARWSTSRAGSASCPSWPPAWRCSCCSPLRC